MDRCRARDIVFVRHVEGTEWHEVLVTAKAEDGSLCILTGGGDHYMLTAEDVGEVVVRKGTAVPAVIRAAGGLVVRLGLRYSPAQKEAIFKEAKGLVVEYEKVLGPPPPPRLGGAEPVEERVPTGALVSVTTPSSRVWLICEEGKEIELGGVVDPPPDGYRISWYGLISVGGGAIKVNMVEKVTLVEEEAEEVEHLPKDGSSETPRGGGGDVRTLAEDSDGQNARHKDWRAVAFKSDHVDMDGCPMEVPPPLLLLIKQMQRHGGSLSGWLSLMARRARDDGEFAESRQTVRKLRADTSEGEQTDGSVPQKKSG